MMTRDVFSEPNPNPNPNPTKKRRNLRGTPDPDAEVVALSPKSLMATARFVCEICNKGFQRDQNLQLHRRGHNLPWKLKQRANDNKDPIRKKVYVCPEETCVHHDPTRALGDLTGIKKHYSRKHGEKKWKCEKCSKRYAVQSDWKAHSKTCGTREYKCDCGTLFSRRDSFVTHRAFCDALAEERSRINTTATVGSINFSNNTATNPNTRPEFNAAISPGIPLFEQYHNQQQQKIKFSPWYSDEMITQMMNSSSSYNNAAVLFSPISSLGNNFAGLSLSSPPLFMASSGSSSGGKGNGGNCNNISDAMMASLYSSENHSSSSGHFAESPKSSPPLLPMSATALLQKAAQMGSTKSSGQIFSGTTTMMGSSSSSSPPSASTDGSLPSDNGSELHLLFGTGGGGGSNGVDEGVDLCVDLRHHRPIIVQPPPAEIKQAHNEARGLESNSLTRDFLGVSGGGGGAPPNGTFVAQEMAKFAAVSSSATAMGDEPYF